MFRRWGTGLTPCRLSHWQFPQTNFPSDVDMLQFQHQLTHPLLPSQLYELDADPKRKEFLDDLFSFMQKRGEVCLPGGWALLATAWGRCVRK